LGELKRGVNVVGDRGAQGGKTGERDAGHGQLVGQFGAEPDALLRCEGSAQLEAFQEFARPVIDICRAATVACDQRVTSAPEALEKQAGCPPDVGTERLQLGTAFEEFQQVVAAE